MSEHVFPWIYAYTEDPTVGAKERLHRMGRLPLRPILTVTMVGPVGRQKTVGLVDSGSEHTLAGPWLARATGCHPGPEDPELEIGIGGRNRLVRFTDVTLELSPPQPLSAQPSWTWSAQVGIIDYWDPPWPMLLGQVCFFDQFTVTMNRHAQGLAVERLEEWDDRFGDQIRMAHDDWRFGH